MRLLILAAIAVPFQLRAQQPQPIGWKDPELATILGVVFTGGGQFYASRPAKGVLLLAGSVAAVAVAIHGAGSTCGVGASCGSSSAEAMGVVGAVALWVYGWATASHDAALHNDAIRNGTTFAPFLDHQDGRSLVGLAIR